MKVCEWSFNVLKLCAVVAIHCCANSVNTLKKVSVRPLDLKFDATSRVDLVTSVQRFRKSIITQTSLKPSINIVVDLISILHVGDSEYFAKLDEMSNNYDIVLHELITDNKNVYVDGFKRQLSNDVFSPDALRLASEMDLKSQLEELDFGRSNPRRHWYIADIDSTTLRDLEAPRKRSISVRYWKSLFAGRAQDNQLLKNFFLSDKGIVTTLRILSWLAPCPELSCLLLDWARTSPNAGGLPLVLQPIFEVSKRAHIVPPSQSTPMVNLPTECVGGAHIRSEEVGVCTAAHIWNS